MPAESPAERALVARIGAYSRWSTDPDPVAALAPARATFRARFEREVDPDGVLSPAERARRTEHARSAYYSRLALRSAQVRRRRRAGARADADSVEIAAEIATALDVQAHGDGPELAG